MRPGVRTLVRAHYAEGKLALDPPACRAPFDKLSSLGYNLTISMLADASEALPQTN